jgi:hypothetical protein
MTLDVFAFVSLEERSNPFGELAIIMSRVLPKDTEAQRAIIILVFQRFRISQALLLS